MLSLVLAITFDSAEQQLLSKGLIWITSIGLAGYVLYKSIHVIQENWPKVEAGSAACVDFWYNRREQIVRRRAQLASLRADLQRVNGQSANSPPSTASG